MAEQPLPESVQGAWYLLPADEDPAEVNPSDTEVMVFGRDGYMDHFEIKGGAREHKDEGDYTFDGQFLILRGRSTKTYRVEQESHWNWLLEGKKNRYRLVRALIDYDDADPLDEESRREISMLPLRVKPRSDYEGGLQGDICRLVYEADDGERLIGALGAMQDDDDIWIGVLRLAEGLEPGIWRRIVEKSYLGAYRDDVTFPAEVALEFVDAGELMNFRVEDGD